MTVVVGGGIGVDVVVVSSVFQRHYCPWLSSYNVYHFLVPGPNIYLVLGHWCCPVNRRVCLGNLDGIPLRPEKIQDGSKNRRVCLGNLDGIPLRPEKNQDGSK